ncbi:P-loop containing nucleoside triphosphate hydrolase protein [Meredithblackwellia eburnea MCA 4105]
MAEYANQKNREAVQALNELDRTWYTKLVPRFIDVIGDFAGQELFICDGDAVVQYVLDDELLALGRDRDPSFQLLHATFLLERLVQELLSRDCTFEVGFFDSNRLTTTQPGESLHRQSSRSLVRCLFQRHIAHLGIKVHQFESFEDKAWLDYYQTRRPMFLLGADGGLQSEQDNLQAERILLQRAFLFHVMQQGVPVVLLQPADFKDGKIISYLYDRRRNHNAIHLEPSSFAAISHAQQLLQEAELKPLLAESAPSSSLQQDVLSNAAKIFLSTPTASREPTLATLLYLFLLGEAFLEVIPLESRAQHLPSAAKKLETYLETTFYPSLFGSISASVEALPGNSSPILDIDGRVFFLLLLEVLKSTSSVSDIVGPTVSSSVDEQWRALGQTPVNLEVLRTTFPLSDFTQDPSSTANATTVLPFSHPVFDQHLTNVHVSTSLSPTKSSTLSALPVDTIFNDTSVWHGAKPVLPTHLGGPPPVQLDARERKKKDRRDQRYLAAMQKSAASLTGASGAVLKQQVIPAVGRASKAKPVKAPSSSTPKQGPGKPGKEGKTKPLTSKEKLLAEHAAKKQALEGAENATWWDERLSDLKPLEVPSQIAMLVGFLKNRRAVADPWLRTEITLKRLDLELRTWVADDRQEIPAIADVYRVFLARTTRDLLESAAKGTGTINEKQGKALMSVLESLGLLCMAPPGIVFGGGKAEKEKDKDKGATANGKKSKSGKKEKEKESKKDDDDSPAKLSFKFITLIKSGELKYDFMPIKEDPLEFQLRTMGEWMVRSLDSQPDARVSFEPDRWQREVLDKIERDESMLISAPTSSGKTFIAFAAFEKVLRESDTGICVYVAPSKALVNQVAAEVFARFSKDVPGANLWAIHTMDYRINNPSNCQILVTVPQVLSLMLLNPALASVWAPRLRRVVLDEIHNIASDEGGAVWEQVLLMSPAPLIALSATVGDPLRFSAWLESVENNRGRTYSFIEHHQRYNALRKYAYVPDFPLKKIGTLQERKPRPSSFSFIHPVASLGLGVAQLPSDLALEPADTLSLWQAMVASGAEVPERLTPRVYFAKTPSIAIRDVIVYEKELKELLVKWMAEPNAQDSGSPFKKVVKQFEEPLKQSLVEPQRVLEEGDEEDFLSLFLPLLADLNAQGSLPAIMFNFDPVQCESIAKRIANDLEEAEERWRMKSPEYKMRVAKAKEDEKAAKARMKAQEAANRNKKDENDVRADEASASSFDPEDPSEEFSFVGKGISMVEFKKEVSDLAWMKLPSWLIGALRRGIGVHHAGLPRRYRTLVENLFRQGVLKCVISTGTLALGINAPARTCVFAGDSIHLTPLQFRQAAGRAGRRGFDTLGLVVFVAVTLDRIQRLFVSRLPKLGGTFPLSATLVLRLHQLLNGSNNAELPKAAVDSILTLPQLSVGDVTGRDQVRHFMRFSIEYLRRAGLLDEVGRPMNLYGLVSSLYAYEPANFAFVALLRSGELHRLAESIDMDPDETVRQFLIVLANLFARAPRRSQSAQSLEYSTRNSTSIIILPPVSKRIAQVLEAHDRAVVNIFQTYGKEFAQQHASDLGEDNALPLSKTKIEPKDGQAAEGALAASLRQTQLNVDSRSLFVANSGHGDLYKSIPEISSTSRTGLVLTKHAVPFFPATNNDHQLDAFVLDFFKHGSLEVLCRDNNVVRGEVWFQLKEFDTAVTAIKAALETLLQQSSDDQEDDQDSDASQDEADDEGSDSIIARPPKVNDSDWRLYRAIATVQIEFRTRFFKVFA